MTTISRTGAPSASLVQGEFAMTAEDFRRIGAILYADSGISLPDGKIALVYSRLAKRLRALGLRSFREYCELIGEDEGASERKTMLMALTTNVTRFFREPHHFEHLSKMLREHWIADLKAGGRLRIWSAGCSTGEEPYSIAMSVLACLPDAASLDVRILATDIDANVLETAKRGSYSAEAASQIPQQFRAGVDADGAGRLVIAPAVRQLVRFAELNLMSTWPMKGPFEAIFCRNVAIYFDEATQDRLWANFGRKLSRNGRLYIGHSERVSGPGFIPDGQTVYRASRGQS